MASAPQSSSLTPSPTRRAQKLRHIMLISGDLALSETLQMALHQEGHQLSTIYDGLRGLLAIKRLTPDVVLVDWAPPRLSGTEICTRLRTGRTQTPIILMTQGNSADERITGLKAGANDCISPPFDQAELIARIQSHLPCSDRLPEKSTAIRCAGLLLNRQTREVFRGDVPIRLTAKEFDLLEYLMDNYFQVLTRSQILENVWGFDYMGSSNIIEVYIRYLRRKLEANQGDRVIHTVRSIGYILRDTA